MPVQCQFQTTPSSPYGWEFIDDLAAVPDDENAIIEFLLHRINREQIYTWVGQLLLAVNPEKSRIRDIYDESYRKAFTGYAQVSRQNPSPHIYAVASRAQYRLLHRLGKVCQVIVISGESGTGKTFNARKALDFLAATNSTSDGFVHPTLVDGIVRKIGNVFPLLSAFSTASTDNNSKSSRHGQLVRLHYDDNGVIRGARISSFLLERTRVTAGSNNFEIFYQLIVGLSDREIDEFRLSRDGKYAMLGNCDLSNDERRRFVESFQQTIEALDALGFDEQRRLDIFRVIALLMHMSNIRFRENTGEGGCIIDAGDEESEKAVTNACFLLSLPRDELTDLLTSILICPQNSMRRHTSYRRGLKTIEDCRNRLASIIRYLYGRLFDWIVDRVNESLTAHSQSYDWLGILDIFGFESFEHNGLEQLCINYSTERLQLYFMEDYLEAGERELREEGLGELPPSFVIQIYRDRLSVIESIVFSTFNDACQSTIPPCMSSLRQRFSSKEKKVARFLNIKNDVFVINHYSRAVDYNVDDLLSKNTDKVPTELSSAFDRCENKLLRKLSEIEDENIYEIGCRVSMKKCTALAKIKRSLDRLIEELNKCDSHYVRCIGPRQDLWAKNEFRDQLACTGILDALPLARCKFPIRFTYEEFYKRYSIRQVDTKFDLLRYLRTVIDSKSVNSSTLHLGNRLLFTTESFFLQLEQYRKNHRSRCAKIIQSSWRKIRERSGPRIPETIVDCPSSITVKIDAPLKNVNGVSIVVTEASRSSSEDDDVFAKNFPFAEDPENDDETKDDGDSKATSVEIKMSQDFPVPSIDTGYAGTVTIGQKSSQPSQEKMEIVDKFVESTSEHRPHVLENYSNIDGTCEIGSWKEFYLRNWLETARNDYEPVAPVYSTDIPSEQFKNQFHAKYSHTEIPANDSTLLIDWNNEKFFYRNRIVSRRRLVEIPIRFHTRLSCLPGSHRLPRSMLPRGLEDCLS